MRLTMRQSTSPSATQPIRMCVRRPTEQSTRRNVRLDMRRLAPLHTGQTTRNNVRLATRRSAQDMDITRNVIRYLAIFTMHSFFNNHVAIQTVLF